MNLKGNNRKIANLALGAIALAVLLPMMLGGGLIPSPQATSPQAPNQTPGSIRWNR